MADKDDQIWCGYFLLFIFLASGPLCLIHTYEAVVTTGLPGEERNQIINNFIINIDLKSNI